MNSLERIAFLVSSSDRRFVDSRVRMAILQVYDHTCQHCLGDSGLAATEADHIIPINPKSADYAKIANLDLSDIGTTLDCAENLTASCKPCNIRKLNHLLPPDTIANLMRQAKLRMPTFSFLLNPMNQQSSSADTDVVNAQQLSAASIASSLIWAAAHGEIQRVSELAPTINDGNAISKAMHAACVVGSDKIFQTLVPHQQCPKTAWEIKRYIEGLEISSISLAHLRILVEVETLIAEVDRPIQEEIGIFDTDAISKVLDHALYVQRPDLFEKLVTEANSYTEVEYGEDRRLIFCSAAGYDKGVSRALFAGANPAAANHMAFIHALRRKKSESVMEMIDHGADHSVNDYRALSVAVADNNLTLYLKVFDLGFPKHLIPDLVRSIVSSVAISEKVSYLEPLLARGYFFDEGDAGLFSKICILPLNRNGTFGKVGLQKDRELFLGFIDKCLEQGADQHVQDALMSVLKESTAPDKGTHKTFRKCPIERQIVNMLVDAGADFSATGKRGFLWAAAQGESSLCISSASKFRPVELKWHIGAAKRLAYANENQEVLHALDALQNVHNGCLLLGGLGNMIPRSLGM